MRSLLAAHRPLPLLLQLLPLLGFAAAGPAPLHGSPGGGSDGHHCVPLRDPPTITEVVPHFSRATTSILKAGVYTLGPHCGLAGILGCVAEVIVVARPTVHTITGVAASTTTFPVSAATTFVSHGTTYCWNPSSVETTTSTVTVTATRTPPAATVTATATATATVIQRVTATATATATATVIKSVTATATATALETVTATATATAIETVTINAIETAIETVTATATAIDTAADTATANDPAATVTAITTVTVTTAATSNDIAATVTAITTATVTSTVTSVATALPTTACAPPALRCDKYGYLIQYDTLYRVDLANGSYSTVAASIDSSAINAVGYNILDNYMYGKDANGNLLRISSSGSTQLVGRATNPSANVGDIDTSGYYWYGTGGTSWAQVDLRPGSATYGSQIAQGTSDSLGISFADWVYVPIAGQYMWAVGTNSASQTVLARWGLSSHLWEIVATYPEVTASTWGAQYGLNNGTLYGSDNNSGHIWAFSLLGGNGSAPYMTSAGPAAGMSDGARCVLNLLV